MYHVFRISFIKSFVTRDKMLSFFAKKDDEYDRFIQENAKENYVKIRKASFVTNHNIDDYNMYIISNYNFTEH